MGYKLEPHTQKVCKSSHLLELGYGWGTGVRSAGHMYSSSAFDARVDVLSLLCWWQASCGPEFGLHRGFGILRLCALPHGTTFGMDSCCNCFDHTRPHAIN